MCAYVVYAFLGGLAAYILVTVMAFAYLPWWQAVLASAGFFALEVLVGRYLVRRFFRRIGTLAEGVFDIYGKVMRGSTVDVHHVRSVVGPATPMLLAAGEAARQTYDVEFTLFPSDLKDEWEPDNLVFVAESAPTEAAHISDIDVVDGGDGSITGVRRLRVLLEVPAGVTKLVIRYGASEVGAIDLTKLTPTTGRDS